MPKKIDAIICFLTTAEGGRRAAPRNGVRAQLRMGDVFTSCIVRKSDGLDNEEMELGKEYKVSIELPFWEEYKHLFDEKMVVELHEGSRVVGRGHFC